MQLMSMACDNVLAHLILAQRLARTHLTKNIEEDEKIAKALS